MGDQARRVSSEVQRQQMLEQIHAIREDKNRRNQQRRIQLVENLEQGRERRISETETRRRRDKLAEKMYIQCFGTTDLMSSDDSDDADRWYSSRNDDFDPIPAMLTRGRRSSNVGPSNVGPSNVGPSNVGPSNVGPANVGPSNDNALVVLPHDINRIVSSNIAQGVEKFPIPVFNQYGNDEPPGKFLIYLYSTIPSL
ncbi:hypothetical protein M0R45_025098 [Rubus argutus]|uniref:Uncharacterized protein n=1 Tax=Rubus argutus TaxID=59490 RepID=A0AAW1WTF7_RUBAR